MIKRIALILAIGLGFSLFSFSQDSIPLVSDLTEEKNLKFQEYFFKALSDRAIRNYQKAIGNLEMCNEMVPNSPTVYFEFSKNYFLLQQNQLAKEYIYRAIEQKPQDIWLQLHLVKILRKERNFKEAIEVQKKLMDSNPKRKEELVYLYLQDRDYKNAVALMNQIEKERGLSKNLNQLKQSLEARKADLFKKVSNDNLSGLISEYNETKSLKNLIKILEKSQKENPKIFHEYAEKALDLFPAQPSAYLYRAKSLSDQKLHEEALLVLETGLDFVIDNNTMTKLFYEEMASNHKALGNQEKYLEMLSKVKQL